MNPKVWGFESPSGRDIFCLKNFDTFTRTPVRVSKMNAELANSRLRQHHHSRLRQHRHLPVVQHVRFMPQKLCQKHNLIRTYHIYMHVCWCWFWCSGNREGISSRKETSCFSLLSWTQDTNPWCLEPILQQTECPIRTKRLNYWGSAATVERGLTKNTPRWRYQSLNVIEDYIFQSCDHISHEALSDGRNRSGNTLSRREVGHVTSPGHDSLAWLSGEMCECRYGTSSRWNRDRDTHVHTWYMSWWGEFLSIAPLLSPARNNR